MIVRQDKLGLIVSSLGIKDVPLIKDEVKFSNKVILFFKRLGVILDFKKSKESIQQLLNGFIPINKHYDLNKKVYQFTIDRCKHNPECILCEFSENCDYFNRKNDWAD